MKCMPKKRVCETHGRKAHDDENNNDHEALSDKERKEEELEHCKTSNEKESSDGAIQNKNHKCKENESFKLIKKLKGDVEKAGMAHGMLERKSVYVED